MPPYLGSLLQPFTHTHTPAHMQTKAHTYKIIPTLLSNKIILMTLTFNEHLLFRPV